MIEQELALRIVQHFGHTPTAEQQRATVTFCRFMTDRSERAVMVLRGSAGTGKTTLAAAIVRTLADLKQKLVLMAPTGRAAKVFALYSGQPAFTIHRRIYRQRTAGDMSAFNLNNNLHRDTLFIIDEASMISGQQGMGTETFGTGCLLDDLIGYVYNDANCRLMFIGDTAQLPPVGEEESPALNGGTLGAYGLQVYQADMTEVLRQSQESGILFNATHVRRMLCADGTSPVGETAALLPRLRIGGFADITVVPGNELIEQLASSYSRVGVDETMVITRSNKRANIYNQGIRRMVLDREEELCRGDQLMIVKNNYSIPMSDNLFLANGDRCVVQRVRRTHELYGFRFAEITLQLPDYDDCELTATAILDTLTAEAPALTRQQQEQLYEQVMQDYADVSLKADRLKQLKTDVHYNALQVKYGYAVTCHKAQGGQWAHVYIDQGYMNDDMVNPDYVHWLYTALTRATEQVFLVNWPATQLEGEEEMSL